MVWRRKHLLQKMAEDGQSQAAGLSVNKPPDQACDQGPYKTRDPVQGIPRLPTKDERMARSEADSAI
jgi:hypothetical protein